jgi:hypothetical protein
MRNKIEDLRNLLFETVERLLDEDNPMEVSRAKAIADVAGVIVDSAKVEVDMARTVNGFTGSGFIPVDKPNENIKLLK